MPENAFNRLKSYTEDILKDRSRLIRILLILFILMLALVLRLHENAKADITVESSSKGASAQEICVDIGGAVVNPGVYTVSAETRLYEVIELAGGLLSNADTDAINRAEFLEDGQKIIIPARPQVRNGQTDAGAEGAADPADTDAAAQSGTADAAAAASAAGGLVNINYASKEELMTLTGIGEAKADSIIEYRSSTRFKKKEDIKSVDGIGDSIYEKIKDSITV